MRSTEGFDRRALATIPFPSSPSVIAGVLALKRDLCYVVARTISLLVLIVVIGCGVTRDDTTGATRQIVSNLLGVNYSDVKPTTTLGELGCDDLDIVELIMEMEDTFDISITEEEFESLGTSKDWSRVTILQLANLARSKRKR